MIDGLDRCDHGGDVDCIVERSNGAACAVRREMSDVD